jgi:hypothetical protein
MSHAIGLVGFQASSGMRCSLPRFIFPAVLVVFSAAAQASAAEPEPWQKEGVGFGGVPAINFNQDDGFGFGVVAQAFFYDGLTKPYRTSILLQLFATTKFVQSHYVLVDSLRPFSLPLRLTSKFGYLLPSLLPKRRMASPATTSIPGRVATTSVGSLCRTRSSTAAGCCAIAAPARSCARSSRRAFAVCTSFPATGLRTKTATAAQT